MRGARSETASTLQQQRTADDRTLVRRIRSAFEHDLQAATDVQGLHFYVRDGVVTIYGAVQHDLDRELLLSLVRQLDGVKDVVSRLHLAEAAPSESASQTEAPPQTAAGKKPPEDKDADQIS